MTVEERNSADDLIAELQAISTECRSIEKKSWTVFKRIPWLPDDEPHKTGLLEAYAELEPPDTTNNELRRRAVMCMSRAKRVRQALKPW